MDILIDFIDNNHCSFSIMACVILTVLYVASLYIWGSTLSRDHPSVIKRRFFSASCMMIFAPFFCHFFMSESSLQKGDYFEQLGLRWYGILQAIFIPLFLTATLFLGPLTMLFMSGIWKMYSEPTYCFSSLDLIWVRNYIMAPLSEEWVFRACMIPLLLQCFDPLTAVFLGPLFFGIAHFHHMFEQMKSGYDFKNSLIISTFQFTYTTIFGAYSAYLFVRTGHLAAPLVAHVFCNRMGFPNFGEIPQFPFVQRLVIICNFLAGFTLWCFMLTPLTSPEWYGNTLHWT